VVTNTVDARGPVAPWRRRAIASPITRARAATSAAGVGGLAIV
jgi:hypothetical protein